MFQGFQDAVRAFREAHENSDTDNESSSLHHTLGKSPMQAAPGNHKHDADYSAITHNHDAAYSPVGHNHDAAYSAVGHNHDTVYAKGQQGQGILASALPQDFPVGISVQHGSAGSGFPDELCTVVTLRSTSGRTAQICYAKVTGAVNRRTEGNTVNTWGAWNGDIDVWTTVTYQNSWSAQLETVQYRKDRENNVHIRGRLKTPTSGSGTTAFTLPVGYRPSADLNGLFLYGNGNVACTANILTTGAVQIFYPAGTVWVGPPPPVSVV